MMNSQGKKVFVGMSGGVDSSVAAHLLKQDGYDVVGVFLRCYSAKGGSASGGNVPGCTTERDAEDARRVAGEIGIPFYVWDFEEEYKKKVVDYMVEGYRQGITPNPDVMCNREIKFGLFYDRAMQMGADFVATGHYVRKSTNNESITNSQTGNKFVNSQPIRYSLMIAKDKNKDQSYFLWTLGPEHIKHSLFPIGNYLKSEVRQLAERAGLSTAEKKDSQGVCFLGNISVSEFLKNYIPEKKGDVLTTDGEKVGEHSGAYFYTIGQRRLGINFIKPKNSNSTLPYFIAQKDIPTNTLVVAEGENNKSLYKKSVELKDVNFISEINPPQNVFARVRYRQPVSRATLSMNNESIINKQMNEFGNSQQIRYSLIFEQPQKFVASGQSAVFYSDTGEMLGGGIIL